MRAYILLFLLFSFLSVCSQSLHSGRILDKESKEPLIGANIYLLADLSVGTTSDAQGYFELSIPDSMIQDSLLISYIGYKERLIAVGALTGVHYLEQKDQLMEVMEVVASPLISEEFKVDRMNKLEIYKSPVAKADPLLAVNAMPSSTTTDESAAISLRGSSSIETGIFLNNVPVYDAVKYAQLNGIGTFSLFNTSLVSDVTVFPGNPPVEFGNTTSGVISISTDNTRLEGSSNSLIVSPANFGFQRDQRLGQFSLKMFANYQPSALLKSINAKALDRIKSFNLWDTGVFLYGPLSDQLTLKTYTYGLTESFNYDYRHPSFRGNFDQKKIRGLNVTNLILKTAAGIFEWNQGYSLSKSSFSYSVSDFEIDKHAVFHGLNFIRREEKYQIKTGLSLDYRRANVAGTYFQYEYAVGSMFPTATFSSDLTSSILEAFIYSKYYLLDNLIIGGGLRKNLNELSHRNYLGKQANLTYLINQNMKVLFGAGDYFKEAIVEERGMVNTFNSKQIALDLFYEKGVLNSTVSFFRKLNQSDQEATDKITGAELFLEGQITPQLSGNASYTFLNVRSDNSVNRYDIGYFIRFNLNFEPGSLWTFSLNGLYREGLEYLPISSSNYNDNLEVYQPIYLDEADRYPNYFNMNLNVSKLFTIDEMMVVTFASISNVTDHKNIQSYVHNFDYSKRSAELYGMRVLYFGVQLNF